MQSLKNILVIRLSAMGDVAMTVPIILTLLEQHPHLKITLVSKPFFKPIFAEIERVDFIEADVKKEHKGMAGLYKLYRQLKTKEIAAVADLHDVLRSKILRFYFKTNMIPVAFINKGRAEKKKLTQPNNNFFKPLKTTHQRYADVFQKLGFFIDLKKPVFLTPKKLTSSSKDRIEYLSDDKLIGIAPFAAHEGKKYPIHLMEKVIAELSYSYKILLFGGGQEEVTILSALAKKHSHTYCIAGAVTLEEELGYISNLSAMISMDSGNGHFAAMFGIPTITLWGVTHPFAGFAPFLQQELCLCSDREKFPLIPTSIYGNKVPDGYQNAMQTIHPKQIIEKVKSVVD